MCETIDLATATDIIAHPSNIYGIIPKGETRRTYYYAELPGYTASVALITPSCLFKPGQRVLTIVDHATGNVYSGFGVDNMGAYWRDNTGAIVEGPDVLEHGIWALLERIRRVEQIMGMASLMATDRGKEWWRNNYNIIYTTAWRGDGHTDREARENARVDTFRTLQAMFDRFADSDDDPSDLVAYSTLQDRFTARIFAGNNRDKIAEKIAELCEVELFSPLENYMETSVTA